MKGWKLHNVSSSQILRQKQTFEQWWLLTAGLRPQGQVAGALVVHQLGVHPLTGQGVPGARHP